jgi:hypothetical protein
MEGFMFTLTLRFWVINILPVYLRKAVNFAGLYEIFTRITYIITWIFIVLKIRQSSEKY